MLLGVRLLLSYSVLRTKTEGIQLPSLGGGLCGGPGSAPEGPYRNLQSYDKDFSQ